MNDQREISVEAAYGRQRASTDPAYFHLFHGQPLVLAGNWTSLISKWSSNTTAQPYAHWLLDALPRLAVLGEFPIDTGILVSPAKLRYQTESLALLGLGARVRWTPEQYIKVENYYFSSPTSMIVCYNPYAVNYLRSRFLPLVRKQVKYPKRFFVRRTSYSRNMVNEEEVLAFFQQAQWAIVDTASLGFLEQIELFAGAEAICAIHGSGTANIVWCSPGCRVIELFADLYLAGDQEWIAQCVSAHYSFLTFPSDHKLNAQVNLRVLRERLQSLNLL